MTVEPTRRRYTEKEVGAILRRAAEMRAGGEESSAAGPTLAQFQQAAGELGLDPALIEAAARDVAREGADGLWARLLGGPWSADGDRIVPGAVTASDWPLLLDEIRAITGRVGDPTMVAGGFEWLSREPDSIHVTATPDGNQTRLRIAARFGGWGPALMVLPFFGGLLLGGIASGLTMDSLNGAPVSLGLALLFTPPAVAVAAGRVAFGRLCARRRRSTHALMAAMEGWFARRELRADNSDAHHTAQAGASESSVSEQPLRLG